MEHSDQQSAEGQPESRPGQNLDILAPTAKSLIAISAAAALNCHPCLNYLIPAAIHNGVLEDEIGATLGLVGQIKRNAAGFTDKLVTDLLVQPSPAGESKMEC